MLFSTIRISTKSAAINMLKAMPVILILVVFNPFSASAQKTGDFHSIATGKWSNKGAGPDSSQSVWAIYQAGYTSDWRIKSADSLAGDSINMRIPGYNASSWLKAVVPGTIYTSYVTDSLQTHEKNPDFGTNVDDALANTAYNDRFWYRLEFTIPAAYNGKHIWLNMGAVNRDAEIYVNNIRIGTIKGFRRRGMYDITSIVNATGVNVLAIVIDTFNQTQINDLQQPTYMAGNGWDYTPSLPAYSRGITDRVFLSASGAVTVADPYLKTLALGSNNSSATMQLETRLTNHTDTAQNGTFTAIITPGNIKVSGVITLAPNQSINFNSANFLMNNPKLWWPNGYGDPNLYHCNISYNINGKVSDSTGFNFGIRKFNYKNDKFGVLNLYVNGVKVFVRGGCWGMSEYMLRTHGKDYDTRIRFHKEMGFNMIRTWCGTETDDDFYNYCDKYGIMVWDEFFQSGPFNGILDVPSFLANVGEKAHRDRNHACIAIWCGVNEGLSYYDASIEDSVKFYDEGQRLYRSTSNAGNTSDNTQFGLAYQGGISSDGPYNDLSLVSYFTKSPSGGVGTNPLNNYVGTYGFHPEWGAACFPSAESFRQFMPAADLWPRNNVWNYNHEFQDANTTGGGGAGASPSDYINQINTEFGTTTGIEDFCKKAQLKNIEVHKALYEAFGDHMWNDASGILMWMSQPSFTTMIWQTYDFYFDCTGAYWGIKKACEPVHIQWSIASDSVKVINATNTDANNLTAIFNVYNMDGSLAPGYGDTVAVNAPRDTATYCFLGLGKNNLALHRPAVASSTNLATPGAVTDGNFGTRWSSNYTDNEWIYVDLGSAQTVGAVNLYWEYAYGKSFEIQVSNDAQTWTTVYSTTTGTGGSDSISFTPVTARYVKMQGIQRGTVFGYSLYEFQVLAAEPAPLSAVYFLKMKLMDSSGNLVSDNFYWYNSNTNYTTLATNMPVVPLQQTYSVTKLANGNDQLNLALTNPAASAGIAFDVHVQLLQPNGTRVLPVFMNDNYFTILKGETKNLTIEFNPALLTGTPNLLIDQYNSRP
jgi:hypothetical protein